MLDRTAIMLAGGLSLWRETWTDSEVGQRIVCIESHHLAHIERRISGRAHLSKPVEEKSRHVVDSIGNLVDGTRGVKLVHLAASFKVLLIVPYGKNIVGLARGREHMVPLRLWIVKNNAPNESAGMHIKLPFPVDSWTEKSPSSLQGRRYCIRSGRCGQQDLRQLSEGTEAGVSGVLP